jgi:uncharacterized membrane protein
MEWFFEVTFKPFFVITGIGTAAAFVFAFWPKWASPTIGKIPFVREYTMIAQHWGIMVGLMGVFMVMAAFSVEWRRPILIYSMVEKAFMVTLVLVNWRQPYSKGFKVGAAMDATVVVYTVLYFAVVGFH